MRTDNLPHSVIYYRYFVGYFGFNKNNKYLHLIGKEVGVDNTIVLAACDLSLDNEISNKSMTRNFYALFITNLAVPG